MRTHKKEISGFGGLAKGESWLSRPERQADIQGMKQPFAVRGLGKSYGDAAISTNNQVFLMERLNRFLEFNPKTGMLRAESGVTLKDIIQTFVPKGFFVPVTPGTKEVTLGGCLACDVHGKNHHQDGSFSEHVHEFELLTPTGLVKRVQRKDEDLFFGTSGGMGLTGIVTEMTLKLLPIETPFIKTTHTPYKCLESLLKHLSDVKERYSVAWVDLLSSSKSVRSIAIGGDHLKSSELKKKKKDGLNQKSLNIPFYAPNFLLNSHTQKLFNALYFHRQRLKNKPFISTLDSFFYPLDKIGNWNRLYGKRGFYQYQFVVPENGALQLFQTLFDFLKKNHCPVYLAVLKKFGPVNGGYLTFPKAGYTLAMDIPGNYSGLFSLLGKLDDMVMENGGRVYLAKDLHLKPEAFRAMYPKYNLFQTLKKKVDPEGLMQTDLSRRLEIGKI